MSGIALNNLGRSAKAIAILKPVVEGSSQDVIAQRSRIIMAVSLSSTGEYEKALNLVNSVAINRSDEIGAEAQFTSGRIMSMAGAQDDAIEGYLKVKYLFESYSEWIARAQIEAARLLIEKGNKERARSLLKTVKSAHGSDQWGSEASKLMSKL